MSLHYEDAGLRLWHGKNIDILPTFEDASFDSIVTDPPYELGFMGKGWDSSGIAYDVEMWRECFRVLKPGGHLLAFGGTRTWHRIATAIEDAGFEIRDSIAWMYGSGFPKSLDVSKAIDKRGGNAQLADVIGAAIRTARESRGWSRQQADQHFCGGSTNWSWYEGRKGVTRPPSPVVFARIVAEWPELAEWADAVAEAEREVIGTKLAGIATPGDQGRHTVGGSKAIEVDVTTPATSAAKAWEGWGTALKPAFEPIIVARKPLIGTVAANVLEHGTGAINIDACRVPASDSQLAMKYASVQNAGARANSVYGADARDRAGAEPHVGGRFPSNVLLDGSQAKALDEQSGYSKGRGGAVGLGKGQAENASGIASTGRVASKHDDEGGASRFFPTFRYEAKAPGSERPNVDGVAHATVKPLDLMRWLVRLVTRPGGRVLDLFAGSGTTGEAALLEGMEVDLIEKETDHLPLILQRIRKPLEVALFSDGDVA